MMRIISLIFFFFFSLNVHAVTFSTGSCNYEPQSKTCNDSTSCKTLVDGSVACLQGTSTSQQAYSTTQTCWQYTYKFACSSGLTNSSCTQYQSNPACGLLTSTCTDIVTETGQCDQWDNVYQCQTQAAVTTQQTVCNNGTFDALNTPDPAKPASTFSKAVIVSEMLRQAQTYNNNGTDIFSGVSEKCAKGYLGLENCCSSHPGAQSNSAISSAMYSGAFSAVKYAGEKAVDLASPYVFDAMYNNGVWTNGLMDNFLDANSSTGLGTNLASGGFSVGMYGFTAGFGTPATSALVGTPTTLYESSSGFYLQFNPTAFAIAIAINVLMDLMSCTPDEELLAMHKGANLSYYISEKCINDFLGTCLEYEDTYCSFNSVLAKIINIQGKQQLGLPISDCSGITLTQLSSIDFTKIDFSEFSSTLVNDALSNMPSSNQMNTNYTPLMNSMTKGTSQSSSSPVTPSY